MNASLKILVPFLILAAVLLAVIRVDGGPLDAGGMISALLAAGLLVWPLTERPAASRRLPAVKNGAQLRSASRGATGVSATPCALCGAR